MYHTSRKWFNVFHGLLMEDFPCYMGLYIFILSIVYFLRYYKIEFWSVFIDL
jgi:hypothetical protein